MLLRLPAALLIACLILSAQRHATVSDLVTHVRNELQRNRSDNRIAKDIRNVELTERLDDRTIEILESDGAGPETVEQLQSLRDRSARLPRPAAPPIPEPPAPSTVEKVQIWNAAHDNAASYTESLPNFICAEVVRRYVDASHKGWKLEDTLALKLTYFDHREEYKLMTVNNHSTSLSYDQMRGAITEGEFGSMLAAIFGLKARTNRDWDHWTMLRSRPTHVYTFAIAAANSDYQISAGTVRGENKVRVGQHGYIYIDDATKSVMRLVAVADQFPPGFDVQRVNLVLDYDFTDVGGTRYLLPLHSETTLTAAPFQHRNETAFLQYRKFAADTTITYDGTVKK